MFVGVWMMEIVEAEKRCYTVVRAGDIGQKGEIEEVSAAVDVAVCQVKAVQKCLFGVVFDIGQFSWKGFCVQFHGFFKSQRSTVGEESCIFGVTPSADGQTDGVIFSLLSGGIGSCLHFFLFSGRDNDLWDCC